MSEPKAICVTGQLNAASAEDAPLAAITFALKCGTSDGGIEFLRAWNEGDFGAIREEWPDAPESVFIGADPLHPKTQAASRAKGNVVVMGDEVFAGIGRDDQSACTNAMVIEFKTIDVLRAALQSGHAEFTVFE